MIVRGGQNGQGVVWPQPGAECVVVTAGHVVKDGPEVSEIEGDQGVRAPAELRKIYPSEDLALLKFRGHAEALCGIKPWSIPTNLKAVLAVESDGALQHRNDDGSVLTIPVLITGHDDLWLRVAPRLAQQPLMQTYSGSPLVISGGQLAGLLIAVAGSSVGNVLRADRIEQLIDSMSALFEVERVGGYVAPVSAWVRLITSVDFLPPLPDFGKPDFWLRVHSEDRELLRVRLSEQASTEIISPRVLSSIKQATLSIVEEDSGLFGPADEVVTKELRVDGSTLLRSPRLRFRIADSIFRKYPNLDRTRRDMRLNLSVEEMNPDSASGPDADPVSPRPLPAGDFAFERVDFSAGDATDHVRVDSAAGRSGVVVWLLAKPECAVEVLGRTAGVTTHSLLKDRPVRSPSDTRATVVLAQRADDEPLVLRVAVSRPGDSCDYVVYAAPGQEGAALALDFLRAWLEKDVSSNKEMFFFEPPPIGEVVGRLVAVFDLPRAQILRLLDRASAHERISQGVFSVLEADVPGYRATAQQLTDPLAGPRMALAVLAAEKGDADTGARRLLGQAVRSPNVPLAIRAIEAVGALNDLAYANATLEGLLLDGDRDAVREAASSVLRELRRKSRQGVEP